jgi:hypothetical protein
MKSLALETPASLGDWSRFPLLLPDPLEDEFVSG